MPHSELFAFAKRHGLSEGAVTELVDVFTKAMQAMSAPTTHGLVGTLDLALMDGQPAPASSVGEGVVSSDPGDISNDSVFDNGLDDVHLPLERLMPEAKANWSPIERTHVENCPQCWFDAEVMGSVYTDESEPGQGPDANTYSEGNADTSIQPPETQRDLEWAPFAGAEFAAAGAGCVDRSRFDDVSWFGNGLTGPVFRVRDIEQNTQYALKVLLNPPDDAMERIQRELPCLSALTHPAVSAPLEIAVVGARWTVLSHWVHGQTLGDWLASVDNPTAEMTLVEVSALNVWLVMARIVSGLAALHEAGLTHGHLSPPKVMVSPHGATLLECGLWTPPMGRPDPWVDHLAPECHEGGDRAPAVDLFALGVLLRRALDAIGPCQSIDQLVQRLTLADPSKRAGAPEALAVLLDEIGRCVAGGIRYLDLGFLGAGGMAEVRRVRDPSLRRAVAMKIIKSGLMTNASAVTRFLREAQVTAQLQHPGIVPVYAMSHLGDGRPSFTMKEVDGQGLGQVIRWIHGLADGSLYSSASQADRSAWTFRRVMEVFRRVCETVAFAHDRGVIHRDLKPQNIMLGEYGEVIVLDWGLAKVLGWAVVQSDEGSTGSSGANEGSAALTVDGWVAGTPAYMAPEQARGEVELVDARSDVYALGAILYEILAGRSPYEGGHSAGILVQVLLGPPAALASLASLGNQGAKPTPMAPELVAICEKAMAREPEDRFQSASEVASAIASWLDGAQRQERAQAIVTQADEKIAQARAYREAATTLWGEAEALLEGDVSKPGAWTRRDEALTLRSQAEGLEFEAEHEYQAALVHAPRHIEAHRALAIRRGLRWRAASLADDLHAEARNRRLLRAHLNLLPIDDPLVQRLTAQLEGHGAHTRYTHHAQGAFVGRVEEREAIARANARLVTLVGTAGVGKTRLSKEYALGVQQQYPGGVWFADLGGAGDLFGITDAVGAALNVPLNQRDSVAQLGWVMAGRDPLLLVLDNFEQVVEHADATVQRWLAMAPDVEILVTSRTKLGLDGEVLVPLGPLSVLAAVELFDARARAHRPGFVLTENTRKLVLDIVQRLDCIPLAIELGAARIGMLTVADLSERLAKRFDLLRTRIRGTQQQTLQGSIDWSWNLSSPVAKGALAQTSIFRGGFDLAAAEAVLDLSLWSDAPPVLDVLEALCDHHLLRRKQSPGSVPRYSLFESIRHYADLKLGEDATLGGNGLSTRHAAAYSQFGTDQYRERLHTRSSGGDLQSLTLERENLLAGLQAAMVAGEVSSAVGCALGASELFWMTGPFREGAELLGHVLDLEGLELAPRMRLMGTRGWLLKACGQIEDARAHYIEALEIARALGERRHEGGWLGNLGILFQQQGQVDEARDSFEAALAIARELDDPQFEGVRRGDLAVLLRQQGVIPEAKKNFELALALARTAGDRRYEGHWLGNLGLLYQDVGPTEKAEESYQAALVIARELGDRRHEGSHLGNLACVLQSQNRLSEALTHFEAALSLAREVGSRRSEGIWLGNLGDCLILGQEWDQARTRLERAVVICDEVFRTGAGAFRGSLALVMAEKGDFDQARALLDQGAALLEGVHTFEFAKLLCKRGQVEHGAGVLDAARAALTKAAVLAEELGVTADSELGQAVQSLHTLMDA